MVFKPAKPFTISPVSERLLPLFVMTLEHALFRESKSVLEYNSASCFHTSLKLSEEAFNFV